MSFLHKIKVALLLFASSAIGISAQVDNYAVKFTSGEGIVNLGSVNPLNSSTDYTLQFWMNPSEWIQGASLIRSGEFSIKLGVDHAVILNDGQNHLTITNSDLSTGKWTHLTIRSNGNGTKVTLNNSREYQLDTPLTLPAKSKSIWLGGDFRGMIDEVRLWNGELPTDYNSYWRTTIDDLNPSWGSLAAYWKMDQEQCVNLVDYKGDAHGTFSASGVEKARVTDNNKFRYLTNLAYGNVERFFDRQIDRRHYSISNRIALIGAEVNPNTLELEMRLERLDAELGSNRVADAVNGRKGVLTLDGSAPITLPGRVLGAAPADYCFETWILIDEWVAGATLFSKGEEFKVALGNANTLSVNGNKVSCNLETGKWIHVGVASSTGGFNVKVGNQTYWLPAESTALAASEAIPVIGGGFKGKMDEIMIWKGERTVAQMNADAAQAPLADDKVLVTGNYWRSMDACYMFDDSAEPGFDSFSIQRIYRTMRSFTEGMRGVKFVITVSFNPFQNWAINTDEKCATLARNLAEVGNDPDYDGIDFDFEWPSGSQWNNVANVLQKVRALLDPSKEMTSTPHALYYDYPTNQMADVDKFYFQIYGPNRTDLFKMPYYINRAQEYINRGFPKEKIVMSYATTTTGGWTAASGGSRVANTHPGFYPAGYRGIYNASVQPSDDVIYHAGNDCYYHLTGFDQTYERSQYVVENDLGGIMYWDMGNDLPADHQYSLARAASYAINANVEPLVTKVDHAAVAPEDDPNGPTATPDPDDQGGFDSVEANVAIAAALEIYARYPGYHSVGSEARANLLKVINLAKLGLTDADAVNQAVETYLATTPNPLGGPRDGVKYYLYGVNQSEEASARFLSASGTTLNVSSERPATPGAEYEWTATLVDGGFTIRNSNGNYLANDETTVLTSDAAQARVFPVTAGNRLGLLQLRMSDTKYLVTHYLNANQRNPMEIGVTTDGNNEASNPKKWSSQWMLEEVEPALLQPLTVIADGGAAVIIDGDVHAEDGSQVYIDPDVELDLRPGNSTHTQSTVDNAAGTITLASTGLWFNKLYRLRNKDKSTKYMTIDDNKMLVGTDMDPHNPQQLFKVMRTSEAGDKYSLTAQGVFIGKASHSNNVQNGTSTEPSHYFVVKHGNEYAFDHTMPDGGTWVNGSRALSLPGGGNTDHITTWATGTAYSWWIPEEVTEIEVPATEIGGEYYANLKLPFAVHTTDKAYVGEIKNDMVVMTALDGTLIPAGEPVIVKSTASPIVLTVASEIPRMRATVLNHLQGHLFAADAPATAYDLSDMNNKPAFIADQAISGRNKAFIATESSTHPTLHLDFSATVGIESVTAEPDRPSAIFDLQGRRVANPGRGLYIANGKLLRL